MSAARTRAQELLAAVAAQLIVPPDLRVYARAEPGDAVAVLQESARRAALLVVGRDKVSWGERLLMGAVGSQIVTHLECPLVIAPSGWRVRHAWPRRLAIVALDGESDPEPALQLAFDEARLRDARLIALQAQPMGASARDKTAAPSDLAAVLANWERDHPDVAVSTAVVSGDPMLSSYAGRGRQPFWSSATRTGVDGETGPGRSPAV